MTRDPVPPILHLVVMGVVGAGKSVVGEQLAERIGLQLVDEDDFHPAGDVDKMLAGQPLDEADRAAWVQRLAQELRARPGGAVLACAALKRAHRDTLRLAMPRVHFLHLALTPHQALDRMAARTDQFYPPSLTALDFEALEDPSAEPDVLACDANRHVDRIVEDALRWLAARGVAFDHA